MAFAVLKKGVTPMRTVTALLAVGLVTSWSEPAPADPALCQVTITSPAGGQVVGPFSPVTGTVSPRATAAGDGTVFVVIHPDRDFYWVGPIAHVSKYEWLSPVQFGIPQTPHGFHFEIRAFVAPVVALQEGDRLSGFPDAACASNLVHVFHN
jgi:hypothetical protein